MTSGFKLKALDAMNKSCLSMMWKSLGHELRALDAIDRLGLWMTWTILCHKLRLLNFMNHSGLWMRWTAPGYKLSALDNMNNSGLSLTWKTPGYELKPLMLGFYFSYMFSNKSKMWLECGPHHFINLGMGIHGPNHVRITTPCSVHVPSRLSDGESFKTRQNTNGRVP